MKQLDQILNIHTSGVYEVTDPALYDYNRTESTEYEVLETLFKQYQVEKTDKLVDFGAGKGRILFYVHYYYKIPVTGIEMHNRAFEDLMRNKVYYFAEHPGREDEITLVEGLVEEYEIKEDETIFYFFNPFSLKVFEKALENIHRSLKKHPRQADIIYYYPSENVKDYILNDTTFEELKTIKLTRCQKSKEEFVIFRSQRIY